MSFNEDELIKIKHATSGWFKGTARKAIAEYLLTLQPKIESLKNLPDESRQKELKKLINEASSARHAALNSGAKSYGHADWAAAAAGESWLHEIAFGDEGSIGRVEALIYELSRR